MNVGRRSSLDRDFVVERVTVQQTPTSLGAVVGSRVARITSEWDWGRMSKDE